MNKFMNNGIQKNPEPPYSDDPGLLIPLNEQNY